MAALCAADAAEARGDAHGALAVIEEHLAICRPGETFWRPWRVRRLIQLALLGPLLPRWVTSRWILAQALQHLDPAPGGVASTRHRRAIDLAVELRGGADTLVGVDATDAMCRVIDRDWVYRQLHLYDLGGLQHFLRRAASSDLVAGADRIHDWASAPMGGFRLRERHPTTVGWVDLATDDDVVTANIGSAALAVPGDCVIGRLVPIEDGAMFEGVPLLVPDDVARRVADDPAAWVDALRALPGGTANPAHQPAGDLTGLVSDVPSLVWQICLCQATELRDAVDPPSVEALASAVLELGRASLDAAREPRGDEIDPWSCVAAALLSPDGLAGLAESVGPDDCPLLLRLADVLAEPAATWCRLVAEETSQAA
jgi:hypothetical protein